MKCNIKFLLSALVLACAVIYTSAAQRRTYNITDFSGIAVSNGIHVYLTPGGAESISATAPDDLYPYLQIQKTRAGSLEIKINPNHGKNTVIYKGAVNVYVTYKKLTALSLSGGSTVTSSAPLNASSFAYSASGGSRATLNLSTGELTCNLSGGSSVQFSGEASRITLNTSGGSRFNGFTLSSKNATVACSGGSRAMLNVSNDLTATASGGSSISYKGQPSVQASANSSSSIKPAN